VTYGGGSNRDQTSRQIQGGRPSSQNRNSGIEYLGFSVTVARGENLENRNPETRKKNQSWSGREPEDIR